MADGKIAYLEIIKNRQDIKKLCERIEELKPKAVVELRDEGLNYDNIAKLLNIGKVNALKFAQMAGKYRKDGKMVVRER
jgi:hypothetical protein